DVCCLPDRSGIKHGVAVNVKVRLVAHMLEFVRHCFNQRPLDPALGHKLVNCLLLTAIEVPERGTLCVAIERAHAVSDHVIEQSVVGHTEEVPPVSRLSLLDTNQSAPLKNRGDDFVDIPSQCL